MNLALFFSRNVSLELWVNSGLFEREKLIYEEHLKQNNLQNVYWFTYGSDDTKLSEALKTQGKLHKYINVISMPKIFNLPLIGSWLYSLILPFLFFKLFRECHVLKTNQMDGSWSAVFAKWLYKKPLIVRTGYTMTQLMKSRQRPQWKVKVYEWVERFAYANADIAVVASQHNKVYLENLYGLRDVRILPNFIDTQIFKPLGLTRYEKRLLFVGRLNKEKNLFNLIEAVAQTDYVLDIYGQGELSENLEMLAKSLNAKVNFKGTVPNNELPIIYNSYQYYILSSYFEGMPKTLLEAMACGCTCIGTDVTGINEIIEDGINGHLIPGTESSNISTALKSLQTLPAIAEVQSVQSITKKVSLNHVVRIEKMFVEEIL